jgi:hypothetical protein
LGWLSHFVPVKPLMIFAVLVGLFGFVHERIWHDSNFGILPNDDVQFRRTLSKTLTFCGMSAMVLYPFLKVFHVPMQALGMAEAVTAVLFLTLETVWSKSLWGISKVQHGSSDPVPGVVQA